MSRRDIIVTVLVAILGIGGAAVVSAMTTTAGPATPYLMWFGFSAVFLSAIGLLVMVITARPDARSQVVGTSEGWLPRLEPFHLYILLYSLIIFGTMAIRDVAKEIGSAIRESRAPASAPATSPRQPPGAPKTAP